MQTRLSDFTTSSRHLKTLPFADKIDSSTPPKKRCRDANYAETYPLRSTISRSVRVNLQLLDSRFYSRHYVRSSYAAFARTRSSFARSATPSVCEVTSSLHLNRTNEDGESLISSVEIFKNCITDVVWDPKDEFFIAARRSSFQLFGAAVLLDNNDQLPEDSGTPLLNLNTTTLRARLGVENRISFGLTAVQFLGSTLNTICGYSGIAKVDIFDLEDLDEETGEALRSFNLDSTFTHEEHISNCSAPTATAFATLSDTLALAALSNGCSAFIDTRIPKPVICTRIARQSDIISASTSNASRPKTRRCNTSIEVINPSCNAQVVIGSKNGIVEIWDLRKCERPIAATAVSGSVEMITSANSVNPTRCGVPLVWLNTDCGDITCLSIGATSVEEVCIVGTNDSERSQSSASLAAPKISVMTQNGLLIYPHIASNVVLFYDIDDHDSNRQQHEARGCNFAKNERNYVDLSSVAVNGDFRSARALLREQEPSWESGVSSFIERNEKPCGPTLVQSFPLHSWTHQISCVSAAKRHDAVVVGGDDGDIHFLLNSSL
ncbi:hypothetical protein ABB37_03953 [Leptomonas pyrrhocoris]|uniref:Guanine nucleotide-binding protein subunit beta-like protein n=1 Tax=Leptomonas pyrrhocoris TaxID=157538 RepID=A0A0M9G3Y2_LEPPY|nr:hypothetical protein ABB37_03953 [Leptomonas pyrrhocoris]KPA81626.1 hypothetical protein ABB37_03953 [Leptomonas pyrrhocoris]|eukprot:XP_015660065.1 hypothetical protein ABB37_03953 [Leptomonas pyrrhocoris]